MITSRSPEVADPNSPELFKQDLQIAQEHAARVQALALRALDGIQNAYRPGNSPMQTQAIITMLQEALHAFYDFMSQSGVGGLPVLTHPGQSSPVTAPTETKLIEETDRSIVLLYDQLKRTQESAAVVANLLSEPPSRGGK